MTAYDLLQSSITIYTVNFAAGAPSVDGYIDGVIRLRN